MIADGQIYQSKKGWVIYIPFFITAAVMVLSVSTGKYLPSIICSCVVLGLTLPMLLNTKYTIGTDNILNVRCGFLVNINIDITTITRIEHTRNPLSAPALSLDRIEVFYNKFDSVMISPLDTDNFIADLKNINPAIEVKQ
ncbi:MAG: PH domain-containing protein [Mucilaginibacter sp.]|nr:PH domain-containing protein [Mucilaginibacter sp.]